jgi:hypothetical protein
MKAKNSKFLKFAKVPLRLSEETGEMLADYSVALGRPRGPDAGKFEINGSGALVRKGNRFGVLTAHHCLHQPGPPSEGGALLLILKRSHRVVVPPKALARRVLAVPNDRALEPDLAFVEILPGPQLRSIQASASFWSLDEDPLKLEQEFAKTGAPFTMIGFPEGLHQTKISGKAPRKIIKHMAFFYGLGPDGIGERDGWDYVEASSVYNGKNEPNAFKGVSSGPLWGLQIKRGEKRGRYSLVKVALIGMAFLQVRTTKSRVLVRGHFIKSIYDRAWQKP